MIKWMKFVGAMVFFGVLGTPFGFMAAGFQRAADLKGLESAEAAGWMQAIGSFAAILGAVGIAVFQHWRDSVKALAAEKKSHREMTLLCYFYFEEFCKFLENEIKRLRLNEAGTRFALNERILEEFRIQFRDLPVHRFEINLLSHVLAFRTQVNEVQRRYSYDISAETRAEMTQDMILADGRNQLHEYLHRIRALAHSTEEHLAGRGWSDPDGLYSAIPKPFRPKHGETI